jgi:hypothetical protein
MLYANGSSMNSDLDFGVLGGNKTFHPILPNIVYNLTEIAITDNARDAYDQGLVWECTGFGDGFSFESPNKIMVGEGQNATCTITNTAKVAQLKLVKNIINDDGGDSDLSDWWLAANTTGTNKTRDINVTGVNPQFRDVFAGENYTLSEVGPANYAAGYWDCRAASDMGTNITKSFQGSPVVEVDLGDAVTCTITNNDNPPILKLVKELSIDDGDVPSLALWDLDANTTSGNTDRDSLQIKLTY